jgi:glutathione S-transferase
MIVVHHLNNSRSQRILWLLEELGAPYRIEQYQRDQKTNLAPPELRGIHPLGKSPVIQDGDRVLAESGAIVEYLSSAMAAAALRRPAGTDEHVRYLHWMHFAEGTIMLHLVARLYLARVGDGGEGTAGAGRGDDRRRARPGRGELARSPHLAGAEFSAADVQMGFPLEFAAFAGLVTERHAKVRGTSRACSLVLPIAAQWKRAAPTRSIPRAQIAPLRFRSRRADASVPPDPLRERRIILGDLLGDRPAQQVQFLSRRSRRRGALILRVVVEPGALPHFGSGVSRHARSRAGSAACPSATQRSLSR